MKPLVSVVTITYNHEPWIEKCIKGVLAQKVNFPIEYIIAEDCGSDRTREICERYASKYPGIIRLLPAERNLGYKENERYAMKAVRGKYIAFVEGDDYWIYPDKLQKQVDFLESHPNYSVCFTRWDNINAETGKHKDDGCDELFQAGNGGIDVTVDLFFKKWCTQPMTMVYRTNAIPLELYDRYKYYRDMQQIYHLLKAGKGYLLNIHSGIRVEHNGGMASLISIQTYCKNSLLADGEFYRKTKEPLAKAAYISTLQYSIETFIKEDRLCAIQCAIKHYFLSGDSQRFVKNIWHIIKFTR